MEEEKVLEINPKKCYFIVSYPDGKIIKGNALSAEAWNQIPSGLSTLKYELSDGSEIKIHQYDAYSVQIDKENKMFYAIEVLCLSGEEVVTYRINLRQVPGSSLKIGDVIIGRDRTAPPKNIFWKTRV